MRLLTDGAFLNFSVASCGVLQKSGTWHLPSGWSIPLGASSSGEALLPRSHELSTTHNNPIPGLWTASSEQPPYRYFLQENPIGGQERTTGIKHSSGSTFGLILFKR